MFRALLTIICLTAASPLLAQAGRIAGDDGQEAVAPTPPTRSGSVASSSVGQAGQRQTRDQVAVAGLTPMGRLPSRVQNRVQSRYRNRIDRSYDSQANATDPFAIAGAQARVAGRPYR